MGKPLAVPGVKRASDLASPAAGLATDKALPVIPELRHLFPGQGLRRGSTVVIERSLGSLYLMYAALGEATQAGSWVGFVGMPWLGVMAAKEQGIVLDRMVMVPYPRDLWLEVVTTMIDGFDLVAFAPAAPVKPGEAARISARLRARESVLLVHCSEPGMWPGADLMLRTTQQTWFGLNHGRGRLQGCVIQAQSQGKGSASQPRQVTLHVPRDWRPPQAAEAQRPALRVVKDVA
ncbi:hypothetical protein [Catelliglobosispora koreensis]|uniref:hypothetical protein n=1 Tax=Catelliglobosispora koreensis TaxID=129052 RepID=UPI0003A005D5|nr:hypothetical protein [Catelliglobosispora koreensis]